MATSAADKKDKNKGAGRILAEDLGASFLVVESEGERLWRTS